MKYIVIVHNDHRDEHEAMTSALEMIKAQKKQVQITITDQKIYTNEETYFLLSPNDTEGLGGIEVQEFHIMRTAFEHPNVHRFIRLLQARLRERV